MVNVVDESVSIDKQGRLVVPAHLRQSLGIKEGGRVMIYQDGKKIVLEPINEDVERRVKEWSRKAREMATSPDLVIFLRSKFQRGSGGITRSD